MQYQLGSVLFPGGKISLAPLTYRANGKTVDPKSAAYTQLLKKFIAGTPNNESSLWYSIVDALTSSDAKYQSWSDADDWNISAWMIPNSDQAGMTKPTVDDLLSTTYSDNYTSYGSIRWFTDIMPIPTPENTLLVHTTSAGQFTFYVSSDYPGMILINWGEAYLWSSFEGFADWIELFSDALGEDISELQGITAAYHELRKEFLKGIAIQMMTLRVPDSKYLPVVIRPKSAEPTRRFLSAMTIEELKAFNNSQDVSYLVDDRSNLWVITSSPPYTVDSVGETVSSYLSTVSGGVLGSENGPIPAPVFPPSVVLGNSQNASTGGGLKWYWIVIIIVVALIILGVVGYFVARWYKTRNVNLISTSSPMYQPIMV